jgi:hypothetical protein
MEPAPMTENTAAQTKKSSPVLVLLAWIVVCIPAAWGIYNTALNAMKLFTETSTTMSGTPQK